MSKLDHIELQAKCLNKILQENINKLKEEETYNKLCYLLCSGNKEITDNMKKIEVVYKIIDKSISSGNYKKAFRYCCYLKKSVEEVININKSI